jgi:hypothetical protein
MMLWEYEILAIKDFPTYFGRRESIARRYTDVITRGMREASLENKKEKSARIADGGLLSLAYPHGNRP